MSTESPHAGAGYRAAVQNPKPQPATQADYERLQAALTLLTNGYKFSTEVVTIARTALGMSYRVDVTNGLGMNRIEPPPSGDDCRRSPP